MSGNGGITDIIITGICNGSHGKLGNIGSIMSMPKLRTRMILGGDGSSNGIPLPSVVDGTGSGGGSAQELEVLQTHPPWFHLHGNCHRHGVPLATSTFLLIVKSPKLRQAQGQPF